jgi:AraC-like DNA-binding protein
MPLFMDLHKASDYDVKPTAEEIKRNHIADLAVQEKYNVKFLQYWINEEAGMVFCLMQGPDKESCAAVHQEAHGGMPCEVIEVKGGDYMAFMGEEGRVNEFDIVERPDGSFDPGYRIILVADIISFLDPLGVKNRTREILIKKGRIIPREESGIMAVFTDPQDALAATTELLKKIQDEFDHTCEIRMSVCAGMPVTVQQEFFEESTRLANRMCSIAANGQIVMDQVMKEISASHVSFRFNDQKIVKYLSREDERFLHQLTDSLDQLLGEMDFSIDVLAKKTGMSRSGLFRSIRALTGLSTNLFVREKRLRKALRLLQSQSGNVTQISMEVGFGNPSYFAMNFRKRFGIAPMKVTKL